MDINNVKAAISQREGINLQTLMLVRQLNEQNEPQPWLAHWDNDKRVRVIFHEEVAQKIKAEPTMNNLAFKYEEVPATDTRAAYKRYVVITPTSVEMTF